MRHARLFLYRDALFKAAKSHALSRRISHHLPILEVHGVAKDPTCRGIMIVSPVPTAMNKSKSGVSRSALTACGQLVALLALSTLGCSNASNAAANSTGGVSGSGGASVTGGTSGAGQTSGSGGGKGTGGHTTATGGQAGTTIQASGGQTTATGGQAGTTIQASGGQLSGGQPASGGQLSSGGQPGSSGQQSTGGDQNSGGATTGTGGATPATGGKLETGGQTVGTGGAMSAGGAGGSAADAAVRDASGSSRDSSGTNNDASQGHDTAITPGYDAKVDPSTLPAVTLWLAGDSTCAPYGAASAQQGWGEHLAEFFNSKVTVQNKAVGGRTVTSFDWSPIESGAQPGDYVMIEFGINDSSTANGRYVSPADFQAKLSSEVDTLLAKKATPIMVTPSALQGWQSDGTDSNTREQPYCDAMKAVATAKGILVDDLNARSLENLNKIGQAAAAAIYINGDKAHFTLKGATLMAQYVTQELVRIGSPLGAYVN